METCPQCHNPYKSPHARLVQEACGHKKCRLCLIREEDGCRLCAVKNGTGFKKDPGGKKMPMSIGKHNFKKFLLHISENSNTHLSSPEKPLNESEEVNNSTETSISDVDPFMTEPENVLTNNTDIISDCNNGMQNGKPENISKDINSDCNNGKQNDEILHDSIKKTTEEADKKDKKEDNAKVDNTEGKEVKVERKRKPLIIGSHITIAQGNPKTYTCTVCVKTFKHREHVRYHNFCASGDKPYKCKDCGRGFVSKSHFEYHLFSHTDTRPYVCDVCNKGFRQKDKLSRHVKIHTGERPFACTKCGKRFIASHGLKTHMRTHTGEKPYLCPHCGRSFAETVNLRKHILKHTGERQFVCEDCGKSFSNKSALYRHQQSHLRVRPFKCQLCPRAFTNNKDLKRHMSVHSDARPFSCKICDTAFRRKDNLERHMKNTHPETCLFAQGLLHKDLASVLQQPIGILQENPIPIPNFTNDNTGVASKQVQQDSSHTNVNTQPQESSCIKSTAQAKKSEEVKPYVELTVPPSILKSLPITRRKSVPVKRKEPIPTKRKEPVPTKRKEPIPIRSKEPIPIRSKEPVPIRSKEPVPIRSKEPVPIRSKEPIPIRSKEPVPIWSKEPIPVKTMDQSLLRNLPQKPEMVKSNNLNETSQQMQNINITNYQEELDSSYNTDIMGYQDTFLPLQSMDTSNMLNEVHDLSTANYNSVRDSNVISFKQMLDPINSIDEFSGGSLFDQIPQPKQRSQAVPVINSPITPSSNYSNINYEGAIKNSVISSYPNIVYDRDIRANSVPSDFSVISCERKTDNILPSYPVRNYDSNMRPIYIKEKIIIEGTNCVPTITKASTVYQNTVLKPTCIQQTVPTITPANNQKIQQNQKIFACKKTGKILETDYTNSYVPNTRTLQNDLHWRKRNIELSQQEMYLGSGFIHPFENEG